MTEPTITVYRTTRDGSWNYGPRLQPAKVKCACFACSVSATAKIVKRIVLAALAFTVLASFVVWVLG